MIQLRLQQGHLRLLFVLHRLQVARKRLKLLKQWPIIGAFEHHSQPPLLQRTLKVLARLLDPFDNGRRRSTRCHRYSLTALKWNAFCDNGPYKVSVRYLSNGKDFPTRRTPGNHVIPFSRIFPRWFVPLRHDGHVRVVNDYLPCFSRVRPRLIAEVRLRQ